MSEQSTPGTSSGKGTGGSDLAGYQRTATLFASRLLPKELRHILFPVGMQWLSARYEREKVCRKRAHDAFTCGTCSHQSCLPLEVARDATNGHQALRPAYLRDGVK